MSFRLFLLIMSLATTAAWIGWMFVIHSIDPTQAGTLGFVLFSFTLFVAVLGTAVLFGTLLRIWLRPSDLPLRQTVRAFRQALILTGLFFATLFLFSQEALRWWTALLVFILFTLVEFLFLSRKRPSA